ncbi:MAG TPA: hypothetical protein VFS99_01520 [Xanthomonadaceae bacterium]|nr:hypothetical protein [Xanthomonadaceae bacterium]
MKCITTVGLFLALLGAPEVANAQAACENPDRGQFDFWLGTWDVFKPDGTLAGTNRIEKEQDGCVVHEHYRTAIGYDGQSLNIYDAARQVWHQTWVDNGGTLLLLEGGLVEGKMVLEGATTGQDGVVTQHRITWTPNADGTVQQFWESTNPAGEWSVAFDGTYRRTETRIDD